MESKFIQFKDSQSTVINIRDVMGFSNDRGKATHRIFFVLRNYDKVITLYYYDGDENCFDEDVKYLNTLIRKR